jgi:hypothetical protein
MSAQSLVLQILIAERTDREFQITMHRKVPAGDEKLLENVPISAFELFGTLPDNEVAWLRRF